MDGNLDPQSTLTFDSPPESTSPPVDDTRADSSPKFTKNFKSESETPTEELVDLSPEKYASMLWFLRQEGTLGQILARLPKGAIDE